MLSLANVLHKFRWQVSCLRLWEEPAASDGLHALEVFVSADGIPFGH